MPSGTLFLMDLLHLHHPVLFSLDLHPSSDHFKDVSRRYLHRMIVFLENNAIRLTEFLKSSTWKATKDVSHAFDNTLLSGSESTIPQRSFCLWNLSQGKMLKWIGERPQSFLQDNARVYRFS